MEGRACESDALTCISAVVGADAPSARSDEFQHHARSAGCVIPAGFRQRVLEFSLSPKQQLIESLELDSLLAGELGAPQANDVQSTDSVVASRNGVGRKVFTDRGAALHQRQRADSNKLVGKAVARNENIVLHDDVAAQQGSIGDNDAIAQMAIVPDVTIGHEEIVGADRGFSLRRCRSVHGDMLAKHILVADGQLGGRTRIFQVLRSVSDHRARMENVAPPDARGAGEMGMRAHAILRPEFDAAVDDREGSHFDRGVNFCIRVNNGAGMNHE
jgi:hypothetical protein